MRVSTDGCAASDFRKLWRWEDERGEKKAESHFDVIICSLRRGPLPAVALLCQSLLLHCAFVVSLGMFFFWCVCGGGGGLSSPPAPTLPSSPNSCGNKGLPYIRLYVCVCVRKCVFQYPLIGVVWLELVTVSTRVHVRLFCSEHERIGG